jgi:DNA-directed RNA polymerase subunit RPC12/RpoP
VWGLIGAALAGLIVGAFAAARRRRRPDCPSCGTAFAVLPAIPDGEPPRGYDVWACPRCVNALVAVHGGEWPWAVCPRCAHRSLQVAVTRGSGDVEHPVRASCDESCPLCGHRAVLELPAPPSRKGAVIAFPGNRPRRS